MSNNEIKCHICGACCIAYEISTLNKPAGEPCRYLLSDGRCGNYENRPEVCRAFKPDEICVLLSTCTLEEKIHVIHKIYGLK
ncbi:MAG: YkgJ family cysteine cluster protein [Calditerrivibrio sp.]|nr:YkgJ family cysteine cluster protein [Calditerrivibrio sp.]